ncbi:MAG: glucosidase family protein [Anaerolineae bacterium]
MTDDSTVPAASFILTPDSGRAAIPFLSWDTAGGQRSARNLLRAGQPARLRLHSGELTLDCTALPAACEAAPGRIEYRITLSAGVSLNWRIDYEPAGITMAFTCQGADLADDQALELLLPFDAHVTATTVLAGAWSDDGRVPLPLIVHAPDWGQLFLASDQPALSARLLGNYAVRAVDLVIDLGHLHRAAGVRLTWTPFRLAQPEALADAGYWRRVGHYWLNALEPLADTSALWRVGAGMVNNREIHLPGMLGNEVISGCATCSLWYYADHILWQPQLSPAISAAGLLRRTLDIILRTRLGRDGSLVCYWMTRGDYSDFLDSHTSVLISAWDYVECSGDLAWLQANLPALELIADFLRRRDVDHDGLVEAVQSGNSGTLLDPQRGCSWWDAINCGHKDGYSNALIYRAWCCLADLEERLGRTGPAQRWCGLAAALKQAYASALLNPDTGWLGWWRSADGELHDPASPLINAMAVEYGLLDARQGQAVLIKLQARMAELGFTRRDLGIPSLLSPIPQQDYLLGIPVGICGTPGLADGSDTFGQYENGGIHAGHTLPWLAALYLLGRGTEADAVLDAMLERLQLGLFQNGVWGKSPCGGEWTTWQGEPSGADGYLADNYRFLQAVCLREAANRVRLYRPLGHVDERGLAR